MTKTRLKHGEALQNDVYVVVVELGQPIDVIMALPLSVFRGLLESNAWRDKNKRESERMEYFSGLAKSLAETVGNGFSALIKTIARKR